MENNSIILLKEDMELINERFGTDLSYDDAKHYRAAIVIWNFWKNPITKPNTIDKKPYEENKEDQG